MPKWPHDDTKSLTAFYGRPGTESNLVMVKPPWQMTYEGKPVKGVRIHRKCAESLKRVFDDIAEQVDNDWSRLPPGAVKFSGSYNNRTARGSSRPSTHAFGCSIDLDAEDNPMNRRGDKGNMSPIVIRAFKREGWDWGGDWRSLKDPMHFQAAYTQAKVASLEDVAIDPPMVDGHEIAEEASIEPEERTSIIETASQVVDTVDTLTTKVKPLTRSRISWGAVGLGASGVASAASAAPPTLLEQFIDIWKSPIWWLVLFNVGLTGYILWHYWKDHSYGALNRRRDE